MIRLQPADDHGLALDVIQIDGGTQSRATLNEQVVNDYAEAIKAGATFPSITVFYDGKKHWLADGFHRFHAYRKTGRTHVNADVRQGTRRDAILHSVGANEAHGLRRTNDDKRRAVLTLLNDAEWAKWSDGEVAKRCAVTREYVNRLRPKDTCDQVTGMERTFVHHKTGEPSTMKIAKPAVRAENAPTGGADRQEEISGETLASQGLHADDRHEKPVEEITSRIILDEFVALWCEAGPEDRDGFVAYLRILGFAITEPVSPSASPHAEAVAIPQASPASKATATISRQPYVLRPHCLKPDLCAGSGADHCHSCKRAMAEGEAA